MNLDSWFQDNEDWRPYADLVAYPPYPEELMREYQDVSPEVLSRCMEMVSEGGGFVSRGAIYIRVRREDKNDHYHKENDKWATMLCLQAPPGIKTNDTFWGGRKHFSEVYGVEYANRIKASLARKGINLKANDEYMPDLARYQGDPEAVVPFGAGRSYIKHLCEKRGWACEGAVNVEHRAPDVDPHENCIPMANDLICQQGRKMIQKDPSLKKLSRQDMKALVLEKHGPSKVTAQTHIG
jgi:hypothetical protein